MKESGCISVSKVASPCELTVNAGNPAKTRLAMHIHLGAGKPD